MGALGPSPAVETGAADSREPQRAAAATTRRALVFVGFMGAGKSTATRAAAAALGSQPLDSDAELAAELGESIESFFEREGEAAFRAREEEVVLGLLTRPDARAVAMGGGTLGSARVREALRGHIVVWLEVDAEEAWRRAAGRGRPLARDRATFDRLHAEREATYLEAADAILPARLERRSVGSVLPALERLRTLIEAGGGRSRLVWATSASGDYPVYVASGSLACGVLDPPDGRRFVRRRRARRRPAYGPGRLATGSSGRRSREDPRPRRVGPARDGAGRRNA